MDYVVAVHFPDGTIEQNVDFSHTMPHMRIGELFFIQCEARTARLCFRIIDIQHQFRRKEEGGLRLIKTNIILMEDDNGIAANPYT